MPAPPMFGLFGGLFCLAAVVMIIIGLYNVSAAPQDRIGDTEIVDLEHQVYCKDCGHSITQDSKFCRYCGANQAV